MLETLRNISEEIKLVDFKTIVSDSIQNDGMIMMQQSVNTINYFKYYCILRWFDEQFLKNYHTVRNNLSFINLNIDLDMSLDNTLSLDYMQLCFYLEVSDTGDVYLSSLKVYNIINLLIKKSDILEQKKFFEELLLINNTESSNDLDVVMNRYLDFLCLINKTYNITDTLKLYISSKVVPSSNPNGVLVGKMCTPQFMQLNNTDYFVKIGDLNV